MKILYFGDVYARPGRVAVRIAMEKLIPEHQIDFVILNGENAAHGNGILPDLANEFFSWGVDVITTGNHAWDQKQIIPYMNGNSRVLRPHNYPDPSTHALSLPNVVPTPGMGYVVVSSHQNPQLKLGVFQVMGRVFMDALECPFRAADQAVERLKKEGAQVIFADFHGEASSEKQAFAYYMEGRVAAVVGSHSHVQTADERVLPGGTAAITDVGMCGCFDSVIGVRKEISIQRFLMKRPIRNEPAEGPAGYGAVIIDADEITGRARSILRLRETNVTD